MRKIVECALVLSAGMIPIRARALSGSENLSVLSGKLDRYAQLVQGAAAQPTPQDFKEAQGILDYFKKLVSMPYYPVGEHFNHDPRMGDETKLRDQIQFIKTLLADMIQRQGGLGFNSPFSDIQKNLNKQGYMADRTTVLKLLSSMNRGLVQLKQSRKRPEPSRPSAPAPKQAGDAGEKPSDLQGQTPQLLR